MRMMRYGSRNAINNVEWGDTRYSTLYLSTWRICESLHKHYCDERSWLPYPEQDFERSFVTHWFPKGFVDWVVLLSLLERNIVYENSPRFFRFGNAYCTVRYFRYCEAQIIHNTVWPQPRCISQIATDQFQRVPVYQATLAMSYSRLDLLGDIYRWQDFAVHEKNYSYSE